MTRDQTPSVSVSVAPGRRDICYEATQPIIVVACTTARVAVCEWHDNKNGVYQCTRTLLISITMPHPDSLSGMGTSRTTTPGSSDIQVMACGVCRVWRCVCRQRSGTCRLRHQGVTDPRGPLPPRTPACVVQSCLHFRCVSQVLKSGGSNVTHRPSISEDALADNRSVKAAECLDGACANRFSPPRRKR